MSTVSNPSDHGDGPRIAILGIHLEANGFAPPTDAETVLLSRLNAVYGSKGTPQAQGTLKGPIGFIVR